MSDYKSYYKGRIINKLYDLFVPALFAKRMQKQLSPLLGKSSHITFICKGNICRSAFAEHHLKKILSSPVARTSSAGISTRNGLPANTDAIRIAELHTVDLNTHTTRVLHPDLISESDLILVMEPAQLFFMHRTYPMAKNKIFLFSALIREELSSWTVDDPFGKDDTHFKDTFHIITKGNEKLLALIQASI